MKSSKKAPEGFTREAQSSDLHSKRRLRFRLDAQEEKMVGERSHRGSCWAIVVGQGRQAVAMGVSDPQRCLPALTSYFQAFKKS